MADYLTRLVERTLGLTPTVRPDIPPTFAPEASEPAPFGAPRVQPPPEPGRAGDPARGLGSKPHHPRSPGQEPAVGEADHEPDRVPKGEAPSVAGPQDGGREEPARADGTPVPENADESRRLDHRSTGSDTDEVGPAGDPWRPMRSSDSAPPDAPATHGPPGAERFGVVKNDEERRGTPLSASSDEPSQGLSGRYEPRSTLDEAPDAPSRSSSRAEQRPGAGIRAASDPESVQEESDASRSMIPTGRDETASQGSRASDPAGVVEGAAPLAEESVPDRRRDPDRESTSAPDRLVPESVSDPGRASGRERPEPDPGTVANQRARRPARPVAPEREEHHTGTPRRTALEVPLVPVANRRSVTTSEREVRKDTSSPTVRVTIGRVEVRAVVPEPVQPPQLPPQQPPPQAMREPALSLEDYLEQHAGGRR